MVDLGNSLSIDSPVKQENSFIAEDNINNQEKKCPEEGIPLEEKSPQYIHISESKPAPASKPSPSKKKRTAKQKRYNFLSHVFNWILGFAMMVGATYISRGTEKPLSDSYFFLNDESISYPLVEQKIAFMTVNIVSFWGPPILLLLHDLLKKSLVYKFRHSKLTKKQLLLEWYWAVYGLAVALFLGLIFSEIIKSRFIVLRPNFLANCQPINNYSIGITNIDSCTNTSIETSRRSFPSGHTTMAMIGGVYSVLLLLHRQNICFIPHKRKRTAVHFWRIILSYSPLIWPCVVGGSRATTMYHYYWDIIGGAVLGSVCSFIGFFQIYGNWMEGRRRLKKRLIEDMHS